MMKAQDSSNNDQRQRTGRYIRRLREEKHYSQTELAREIGVTRQAVCQWESGTTLPKHEYLRSLSAFFGVSVDDLLKGDNETPVPPVIEGVLRAFSDSLESFKAGSWLFGGETNDRNNGNKPNP